MPIVDQLEVVQIHHQESNGVIHTPCTLHLQAKQIMKVPVIAKPRKWIERGKPLRLLVQVRVLQRDRRRRPK